MSIIKEYYWVLLIIKIDDPTAVVTSPCKQSLSLDVKGK